MEGDSNSELFSFDSPLNQSSYIKVIGVGGGGNNAVNHMYRNGITGVDFIVSNTDKKALDGSPVPNKLLLGEGLGAGGRPLRARKAAEDREKEIKELFESNTKMVFITAGMGGGTGTGAAPVIARFAKEIQLAVEDEEDTGKILVVAVVTTPFMFEGNRKIQQAMEGVDELRKYVDSILVINNEKLRSYGNLVMSDAFSMANDVLLTAVKSIAEIITLNAYVNIDFRDVNTTMANSGTALMGIGEGAGDDRALQAVKEATTSVLLNDNDIAGAKNVLLYFSYGPDHEITMDEMGEVTDYICTKTGGPDTEIIWGTGFDESLGDKVKITLIATGFEQKPQKDPLVHVLNEDPVKPVDQTPQAPAAPFAEPVLKPAAPVQSVEEPAQAPHNEFKPSFKPAASEPERVEAPQGGRIFLLDEEEPAPAAKPASAPVAGQADDDIRLVSHTAQPAPAPEAQPDPAPAPQAYAAPQPQPQAQPQRVEVPQQQLSREQLDMQAMARAERIKMVHDLLCNDVNGPQKVEEMNPVELIGEQIYEAIHSSVSDVSGVRLNADGTICENNVYLFGNPD